MITMFLAACFGMAALLSIQAALPPLGRLFGPPVVEVPAGPQAAGPDLPLPSWGRPGVTAAETGIVLSVHVGAGPEVGPVESPAPPTDQGRERRLIFLERLADQIVDSASPRLKALIRTGKVDGRQVLMRTAAKILRGRFTRDPRPDIGGELARRHHQLGERPQLHHRFPRRGR
jgi:hypothetical protein